MKENVSYLRLFAVWWYFFSHCFIIFHNFFGQGAEWEEEAEEMKTEKNEWIAAIQMST